MTTEKLEELVTFYKLHLGGMGLVAQEFTEEQYRNLTTGLPLLKHCYWMLNQMAEHLKKGKDGLEKADRWLGFIQGCCAALQIYTIKELRDQSRSS